MITHKSPRLMGVNINSSFNGTHPIVQRYPSHSGLLVVKSSLTIGMEKIPHKSKELIFFSLGAIGAGASMNNALVSHFTALATLEVDKALKI